MSGPVIFWIIFSSIGFGMAVLDLLNSILDLRSVKVSGMNGDRKLFATGEVRNACFLTLIMANNILVWVAAVVLPSFLPSEAILYGLVVSVLLLTLKILFGVADRYQFLNRASK